MSFAEPRVTIGMPVCNGEQFLNRALDSLLAQTYSNFQLIISDNASIDATGAICRAYAAQDRRIRYHRNTENIGCNRNFNRVFSLSSSRYFKWAAADDVCEPDYLARCVMILEADPTVVVVSSKTRFIDLRGEHLGHHDPGWDLRSEDAADRLHYIIRSGHWVNCLYGLLRTTALAETRLLPSYPGGDYRLLGEMAVQGKFVEIPEHLFSRRLHAYASSQNTTRLSWKADFHKARRWQVCLPLGRLSIDHIITIARSPMSLRRKLVLVAAVLGRLAWRGRELFEERRAAFAASYGRHVGESRKGL